MCIIRGYLVLTDNYQSERRLFYLKDIFIYLISTLIIIGLFLGFVILPNSSSSFNGFNVLIDNQIVFSITADGDISISQDYTDYIEYSTNEDVVKVIIHSKNHQGGFNQIEFNKTYKTAKVTESNCSNSKDCVFSPSISSSGAIYCAPHQLKITAIGGSQFIPPSVG